jgi:hypothetical protein
MQTNPVFRLLVVGLVAVAVASSPAAAQGRKSKPDRERSVRAAPDQDNTPGPARRIGWRGKQPPKETKIETWHAAVEGRGDTPEEAQEVALYKAREALREFVHSHSPLVRHLVPDEFIIKEFARPSPPQEIDADNNLNNIGKYGMKVELTVTDEGFHKILDYDHRFAVQEHEEFVQARLFFLGKILLALVALLSSVVCYTRLEEITKGYYTSWLRLGALGFVCIVGAGLWLFS